MTGSSPDLPGNRTEITSSSQADGDSGIAVWVYRRDLLGSTTPATWLRPVGAQRGIRARDRSAASPSWLTVVGRGKNQPVSSFEQTSSVTHLRPAHQGSASWEP